MNIEIQKISLNIGPYSIHAIPTGIFGLDGGAMFGTVPKILWEKNIPADKDNRIPLEARALLLKSSNKNILIDCGNGSDFIAKYGEKLGGKFNQMYNIDDSGPNLLKSLSTHGISSTDITDVILTHLHFDHCGGATCLDKNSNTLIPTFKNAKYYVQKTNLETAQNPNLRERASYYKANFQPLIDSNVIQLVDGDISNILPNISLLVSNGHTTGQQIVIIKDENTTLIYAADTIPTSSHIRLAWVMGYDLDPMTLILEKQKIIDKIADKNSYVFFEHDPFCDLASVTKSTEDFKIKQKFNLI